MIRRIYLQALYPAFEEHEEGGVGVDRLLPLEDGLGLRNPCLCVCAVQSKKGLHYRVVPQEGKSATAQSNKDPHHHCSDREYIHMKRTWDNQMIRDLDSLFEQGCRKVPKY